MTVKVSAINYLFQLKTRPVLSQFQESGTGQFWVNIGILLVNKNKLDCVYYFIGNKTKNVIIYPAMVAEWVYE